MDSVEHHIINSYTSLFESLSREGKLELIENLKKSLKRNKKNKDEAFFKTFGALETDQTAEEMIAEIKRK